MYLSVCYCKQEKRGRRPSVFSGSTIRCWEAEWAGLRTPYHLLTRQDSRFGVNTSRQEDFLCSRFSGSLTLAPLSGSQASNLSCMRLISRVPELKLASAWYPEMVLLALC